MWRTNNKIGFDDQWLMVCMIPLSAFLIPFVFFGLRFQRPPFFTWKVYLTTLILTVAIWLGNRYIMIWSRNRYPQFADLKRRLRCRPGSCWVYADCY